MRNTNKITLYLHKNIFMTLGNDLINSDKWRKLLELADKIFMSARLIFKRIK